MNPFPVRSRYFVPLMVTELELRVTDAGLGVVTIVGFAGLTSVRSAAELFSLAELLLLSPA